MSNGKTIGGIIMIVLGSILTVLGLLFAAFFFFSGYVVSDEELMGEEIQEKMDLFKRNALETTGEITEIDYDEGTTTIGFRSDIDNVYYEKKIYTVLGKYSLGDPIEVYYNIDDPSDIMIQEIYDLAVDTVGRSFLVIGTVAACVGAVGLILLIVGIVLVVKGKKNNQRNDIPAGNYQNGQF